MEKTEINSTIYNYRSPDSTMITLGFICDKLTGKIHAAITFYLALLDNQAEFAEKYAIKEDKKEDSCFYHIALETRHCYDDVINTIFEISNLLIPFDMRFGKAYENFMHELTKYKNLSHTMFEAIYTVEGYKKFAQDVRRGLLE